MRSLFAHCAFDHFPLETAGDRVNEPEELTYIGDQMTPPYLPFSRRGATAPRTPAGPGPRARGWGLRPGARSLPGEPKPVEGRALSWEPCGSRSRGVI